MPLSEVNISLNIQNNRDYPQQINVMGNPANLLDTANATREFRYDVTTFTFTNEDSVSIQYKLNGASSFTTFTAILPSKTIQGVLTVLNSLQLGYFNTYTQLGSTYISTYNNNYTFGNINIFYSVSLLSLTFDNIANVPVSNPNSLSDWNTFFNTTINATTPFYSVSIVGNTVNLGGCTNLVVSTNLFNSNQHIVSITDNLTIIDIQNQSFFNCNFLTSININNCVNTFNSAFASCASLSSITMNALQSVGASSFSGNICTSISLPLVSICGDNAFQASGFLTTISLPICTSIGDTCFDSCPSITSLNLPNLITAGGNAFSGCTSLVNISLPLMTTIGDNGMAVCLSLNTIYIPACLSLGTTTGDNGVFDSIAGNNITLTIPLSTSTDGDVVYLQANNTVILITT